MTECLFCPNEADSKEHLFGDWMNGTIFPKNLDHVSSRTTGEGQPNIWKSAAAATQELRVLCGTCNSGWLSDLENAVKPLLIPMAAGEQIDLTSAEQTVIAAWAYGRNIVGEYLDPSHAVIPKERRLQFKAALRPPVDAHVYTAANDWKWPRGEGVHGTVCFYEDKMQTDRVQQLGSLSVPANTLVGHNATILVKHLTVHVVGVLGDLNKVESAVTFQAQFNSPSVVLLWPNTETIHWPPARPLNVNEVELVIEHWKGSRPSRSPWTPERALREVAARPNRASRRTDPRRK